MTEQRLWHMVKGRLASEGGKWQRVENPVGPGTPDVHYCVDGLTGWLELKEIPSWPARYSTPVRIKHFTKEQKLWLWDYAQNKGWAHVLLRVESPKTYLLFDAMFSYEYLGDVPKAALLANAIVVDGPTFPTDEMRAALLGRG